MFPPARLEALPKIGAGRFHRRQHLVREHVLVRLHETDIRAASSCEEHGLRYDETLRIGEDYILLASALAKGGTLRGRAADRLLLSRPWQDRSRECSSCIMWRRCSTPMRSFCATMTSMRAAKAAQARRTRSLQEAASFLSLVGHLKDRAPLKAMGAALTRSGRACAISKCRSRRGCDGLLAPSACRHRQVGASGWQKQLGIGRGGIDHKQG